MAESSAERWRFSGGRDSETGSSGGTHVAPSERWRSGWDHEFESPLLHRNHIFELLRRLAEAAEQRRKPQPTQTVYAPGSMEWFAAKNKAG